jgi:D-glycero-D-manno-heptose 1,7-bisphosphate phosphatase
MPADTIHPQRSLRPAIFLDRDGTLNVDTGYTHQPADLQLIDGVIPGLQKLQRLGYPLFILTNQSGVARGYFTETQLAAFHAALLDRLQSAGIQIAAVYACPFHPTEGLGAYRRESSLRKPQPGMFLQAAAEHALDLAASIAIGDKLSDVLAGQAAGCRTILLATGHAGSGEPNLRALPTLRAANLLAAADWIEGQLSQPTGISHAANCAYPSAQLDGASR